jgi:hypothetical protein
MPLMAIASLAPSYVPFAAMHESENGLLLASDRPPGVSTNEKLCD